MILLIAIPVEYIVRKNSIIEKPCVIIFAEEFKFVQRVLQIQFNLRVTIDKTNTSTSAKYHDPSPDELYKLRQKYIVGNNISCFYLEEDFPQVSVIKDDITESWETATYIMCGFMPVFICVGCAMIFCAGLKGVQESQSELCPNDG